MPALSRAHCCKFSQNRQLEKHWKFTRTLNIHKDGPSLVIECRLVVVVVVDDVVESLNPALNSTHFWHVTALAVSLKHDSALSTLQDLYDDKLQSLRLRTQPFAQGDWITCPGRIQPEQF